MSPRTLLPPALAAAAVLAAPALARPAGAQVALRVAAPTPVQQTASINLLGLPFGLIAGEYERAVGTSGFAFGVGGSAAADRDAPVTWFTDDYGSDRYYSLQGKFKYYPSARGLRGFAVGVTAGLASARGTGWRIAGVDSVLAPNGMRYPNYRYASFRATTTRPTVGTVLDYNFLLGRRQRFLVGLGVGARRTLGEARDDRHYTTGPLYDAAVLGSEYRPRMDRTLFDGRLQVGFGF